MRELSRRLAFLFRRARYAADLREEMHLHIELRARRFSEQGVADAEYAARRQFGNRTQYQDRSSEIWGWTVWERVVQDVRMGIRSLSKSPGFTAVAVLTLAIGLGMNTAVYSVVNAVMLRKLPYPHPEQLVSMWEQHPRTNTNFSSHGGGSFGWTQPKTGMLRTTVSVANIADYEGSGAFTAMASFDNNAMNLTGVGIPERVDGDLVSWRFFSVLGVTPVMGRDFRGGDDSPSAEPTVVLSYGFWQQRLGGDTNVLGQTVTLDGVKRRVIGVLPKSFQSPSEMADGTAREFFVPAAYPSDQVQQRGNHDVDVIARLRPDVPVRTAQGKLDVVQARLARQFPDTNKEMFPAIAPLGDDIVRSTSTALWCLLAASGLLVLITCVNVANLLLVRATGRTRELSVRLAVGASRSRLVRLFITESLLLAAGGCAAGIGMGLAITRGLLALAPTDIPRLESTSMDWTVFAFAAGIATLTGLVFGIAPAWHATRVQAVDSLKTSARTSAGRSQVRWLGSLTVAEVALSMVLLTGAGLLLRSFALVMNIDLGFQPDRVLALNINLPAARYKTADDRLRFFEALEPRVNALAGVRSVGYANRLPMRGSWRSGFTLEEPPQDQQVADFQAVSPGYFETLGMSLIRGRRFTAHDREGSPPVAMVNQAFARSYYKGGDPLGHGFLYANNRRVTIVGVVSDIRRGGKEADVLPEVYLAAGQTTLYPTRIADFAVRTAGDPSRVVNAVRQEVLALDKDQPITNVRTMREVIDLSVAERRFEVLLLAVFAAVAVALAVIGIYGVLSYSVAQRTGELGIRIALGAHPGGIVAMVMRQAGGLIAAGLAIGLGGALLLTRYLASLLFQMRSTDPLTYAICVGLLGAAAVAASMAPAVRSARVDPMVALRNE
ncbi:MAG TPA: ABC transporter permease [Verrucomicrobiae bacterium]|nr:ABC transporter permease [Verrucomicrobiae bacterium]